jgi:hypothetical protein
MLTTSSFSELMGVKQKLNELEAVKPAVYHQFVHTIHLTRQLQFKFQYMGSLIMDEAAESYAPKVRDSYVLDLYKDEIDKLKSFDAIAELKQLLAAYNTIGYGAICELVIGKNPEVLVGPAVAR